ncbi:hypothetical protein [Saccharopolyspora mangrovi]|uniref:Uncharacterized protein n=1 Tax=Saccharopolyspora mangrovi TaxID=3082379 RepID=A0ABU6AIL3_9PSEU|nr:hypothetical protein [Saccharopolyspora sp. S2-29]MEB3371266.1 hypothetical protein [Saccharopolyspora sp. S2-29]
MPATETPPRETHHPRQSHTLLSYLFDLRSIIGLLLGTYGVGLTCYAMVATTPQQLEQTAGLHMNLGTGLALLLISAAFLIWSFLRPAHVDPKD